MVCKPTPPSIGPHQNLSYEITLGYWKIGLQPRVWYPLPSFDFDWQIEIFS